MADTIATRSCVTTYNANMPSMEPSEEGRVPESELLFIRLATTHDTRVTVEYEYYHSRVGTVVHKQVD